MFLISPVLNRLISLLPKRQQFALRLQRIDRWKTFEHGYHLLPMLVDPARCAIDVGANEGLYAGKMARYTRRVHCFEPIPWMADELAARVPRHVRVHRAAVSDHAGQTILRIPWREDVEQHGTATIESANKLSDAENIKEVDCEIVTLDESINEPVGFIKIDVEGHELAVLHGAQGIISRDKPVIMVESEQRHNPAAPHHVFEFLSKNDYHGLALRNSRLYDLEGFAVEIHQSAQLKARNYVNNFLFIPKLTPDA